MPHEVIMPALGMAQDTGKLVNWLKADGDTVKVGDVLFEVETDKSTMEVDAQADGFLTNVTATAGDDVPVGNVIALIADELGEVAAPVEQPVQESAQPEEITQQEVATAPTETPTQIRTTDDKILASPKAKRIASESGLNLADLAKRGHPQPYHVADIEVLKALPSAATEQATVNTVLPENAPRFIALEAKTKGVKKFLKWMQSDGNITLEPGHVWVSYAAACLRNALQSGDGKLLLSVKSLDSDTNFYIDADRQRLSKLVSTETDAAADLIIRDITASQITHMRLGSAQSPALTIARAKKTYLLSLEFTSHQMSDDQAIAFMIDFCERLNDPLKHVL